MYRLGRCSIVTVCVLSTELQDGEQEDCGQDSNATHKGHIYDNQIHISISGVCSPRGVVCSENKYKIQRIAAHCNGVLLGCILSLWFFIVWEYFWLCNWKIMCANSASLSHNWGRVHGCELGASAPLLTINTRWNKLYTLVISKNDFWQ